LLTMPFLLLACSSSPTQTSSVAASMSETSQSVPASPPGLNDSTEDSSPALLRGPAHPERATIIDGSWLIGADYPPALYLTPTPVTRCHWRVVDYATGTLIEEGNYAGAGPAAIWVGDGDLFQSEGCYLWQGYPQLTGERVAASPGSANHSGVTVTDGRWTVGRDIPAGRYRSDRASTGTCSYSVTQPDATSSETFTSSGTVRSIPAYLDLNLTDGAVFATQNCGTWVLLE
jgi:hypothetical protein